MKRSLLLALILSLALNACMPAFLQQALNPTPTANAAPPPAALELTMAALAVQSQPTASPLPSSTPVAATPTRTTAPTSTRVDTLTPSATSPASSTPGPLIPSLTPTLGAMFFGTLPPLVPSGWMTMINRSHAQAYVSFQCTNKEGTLSIMEYPAGRWSEVKITAGKCLYVAWVGGRQFEGKFSLDPGASKRIIFFKDRVMIK